MAFIKNIEHETVLPLAEQVTVQPGQIVSRTLAQNKAVSVTGNDVWMTATEIAGLFHTTVRQ